MSIVVRDDNQSPHDWYLDRYGCTSCAKCGLELVVFSGYVPPHDPVCPVDLIGRWPWPA